MDLTSALVILAREAGYMPTRVACKRLDLSPTQLLALRRQMIQQAVGVPSLPVLNVAEPDRRGG